MLRKLPMLTLLGLLLIIGLVACDGDSIQSNPLGYTFVGKTLDTKQQRKINLSPSNAQPIEHLRPYGIGLPPEAFISQYGQALAPSQPPTQLWFKATLDDFPSGSVMIVGFDRSSKDNTPRANEISYIAGDKHPTTVTQAQTIAESFLPDDAQGPAVIHQYDAKANTCLSETYTSATLATLFPAQVFLDASGKAAKPGTVTLSLFPHYGRGTDQQDKPYEIRSLSGPDDPNLISSFLLTLGTKPYC